MLICHVQVGLSSVPEALQIPLHLIRQTSPHPLPLGTSEHKHESLESEIKNTFPCFLCKLKYINSFLCNNEMLLSGQGYTEENSEEKSMALYVDSNCNYGEEQKLIEQVETGKN